jgi:hypothetical protein
MFNRIGRAVFVRAGVVAPILFTGVYLIEGATRPGYDPIRHQVSLLSLGDGGWVQVANFLITGGLLVAFAAAMRAHLRDGAGAFAGPGAFGVTGLGSIVAGVFSAQPLFGYPPGTPAGLPDTVTASSLLHLVGALLLFFGLVVAALVFARRYRRAGAGGWAAGSLAAGVVVLVFFGASGGGPSGQLYFPEISGLLQRISLLAGFGWVAAMAIHEAGPARA